SNIIVVTVDFRLLPLHPLPAAYEDGWTSLQWIASHTSNDTYNNNFERESWLLDYGDFDKVYVGDVNCANIAHDLAMRAESETLPNNLKILGALLCCPFFWASTPIGSEPVEEHESSLAMKVWNFV
ncbi:hypothetical protein RYX36_005243, partial [Vicia faba]